ncbi:MAG: ATP-binding protein [Magnetococcales bacterium]|nr:ATP-binding protein [Magnetococcales bacterium]
MIQQHHLEPKLKRLRLSGMLETLEDRTVQAVDSKISYTDFLERLLEDEIERREQKQLALRLRRAGFDPSKTLETFDFSFNPGINRQAIQELSTCGFVVRKENVLIYGQTGVGKSHLAVALGHSACRKGMDVLFLNVHQMLAHLNAGRADGSYQKRLAAYLRTDLLVMDDLGLRPISAVGAEDLYEVIRGRYEQGAIVVTSNRAPEEWSVCFSDPLLANAALDRINHHAHHVEITGSSYRAHGKRKQELIKMGGQRKTQ